MAKGTTSSTGQRGGLLCAFRAESGTGSRPLPIGSTCMSPALSAETGAWGEKSFLEGLRLGVPPAALWASHESSSLKLAPGE